MMFAPAQTPTPETPAPIVTTPTPVPTPYWLTIPQIEATRRDMTDLQWNEYQQSIQDSIVRFSGTVVNVRTYGTARVDVGQGLFVTVTLKGIPMDVARELNKGQSIEGEGYLTIDTGLVLSYVIRVNSLEN